MCFFSHLDTFANFLAHWNCWYWNGRVGTVEAPVIVRWHSANLVSNKTRYHASLSAGLDHFIPQMQPALCDSFWSSVLYANVNRQNAACHFYVRCSGFWTLAPAPLEQGHRLLLREAYLSHLVWTYSVQFKFGSLPWHRAHCFEGELEELLWLTVFEGSPQHS